MRDDGVGFLTEQVGGNGRPADGRGFRAGGCAQRLRQVAGSLEIERTRRARTAVNASVPAIPIEGGR